MLRSTNGKGDIPGPMPRIRSPSLSNGSRDPEHHGLHIEIEQFLEQQPRGAVLLRFDSDIERIVDVGPKKSSPASYRERRRLGV